MKARFLFLVVLSAAWALPASLYSQGYDQSKFKSIDDLLPTPNHYRSASGAPGPLYYQQKADYQIQLELDDQNQIIRGEEVITYTNYSPDALEYLWVQLDQNMRAPESASNLIKKSSIKNRMNVGELHWMFSDFEGGFQIDEVTDAKGKAEKTHINGTMMRIELAQPLKPGAQYAFKIKWWYRINERAKYGGRSGYEYFKEDDNYLYTIAQFFPRMAVYSDDQGWSVQQFLGQGEFTLPFGDYDVKIKVPADHVVASTGTLQNPNEVLTATQRQRFAQSQKSFENPIMIITPDEALNNEKSRSTQFKTWHFKAKNVRDFAFASSRKFIWDAMAVQQEKKNTLAMSYYPKEGNPLWEKYSTRVVAHTLKTYSKFTFDYPYEVAISVHSASIGMEYPMICFNGGRPEADGTYSERTKYGMIGVIIHEVGHNYFPMIVNSDERQWTWMDEGLNTFLQYLTEQEWDKNYPSRRGPAYKIVDYMKGDPNTLVPIMTNSESVIQFGNNAYGKPATALNILRETILGRENFDFAFKTYSRRWMFKHPQPADFFRTMEDAAGQDLDWFWRGWFFGTQPVDIALKEVTEYLPYFPGQNVSTSDKPYDRPAIGELRNANMPESMVEKRPDMMDFYNTYNPDEDIDSAEYKKFVASLDNRDKRWLEAKYFYQIKFLNKGGLVSPVIIEFTFENDSTYVAHLPAEVWLRNEEEFTKVFFFDKKVNKILLDPFLETADIDMQNNVWPSVSEPSRFEIYKYNSSRPSNPMKKANN